MIRSQFGVDRLVRNVAFAPKITMLTGELDETGFTPVCTPGVLDEPVLVPVVDSVPDSQHSVVDLRDACVAKVLTILAQVPS